jgi:NAD(P)H dehydrogenase (quinone)
LSKVDMSQGGGQETTILTAATQLVHHGMIFIPIGYTAGEKMFNNDDVRGGSPWGAGTLAGADGARMPSATEVSIAKDHGMYFAQKAMKLAG